ncbi:MAG: nitrogen fixation protein FixH [Sulfitobacter sp.]|jgi:nitrogen fixation protein FixH|eukprot:GHVR01162671.1.p2 GENE.GHVR01162671.1~~GHVR01162671.1.p2  ORF type:complete len:151 (-),score=25.54 GHVR01162671.1:185-637(-)
MKSTLTGWHVFGIFAGCFAVIIGVNLTLAFQAVSTFPGLVTKNSYVASQHFNRDRDAQDALGWQVSADITDQVLTLEILQRDGTPLYPAVVTATLGRATHVAQDVIPDFVWDGQLLRADVAIAPGYWTLWLDMQAADGTNFRRRLPLTAR